MPEDPRYPKTQQPAAGVSAAAGADSEPAEPRLPYKQRSYDSTAAVIAQLEASLQSERPR